MNVFSDDEVLLPYSPTHTGRRAKIGFLGIEGANFNDLWPLLAGIAGSVALVMALFIGGWWPDASTVVRGIVAFLPLATGYGYLRCFVQGKPPHFRGDLWVTLRALRFDFSDPSPGVIPLLPVLRMILGCVPGPAANERLRHPLRLSDGGTHV